MESLGIKGYNLYNFRQTTKLTIPDFAEKIGVKVTRYTSFEKGIKRIDSDTLLKISDTFKVQKEDLMNY